MKTPPQIDISFAKRIAVEEWRKFKRAQNSAIDEKLKRVTGTIHTGGKGRKYSMAMDKNAIVLTLVHKDYLRFQDMKKLKVGKRKPLGTGDRGRDSRNSIYNRINKDTTSKRSGKRIHNRLVWGRMNEIAFRCINDLRGEVIHFLRSSRGINGQLTIKI
jgi:hypothetical protein